MGTSNNLIYISVIFSLTLTCLTQNYNSEGEANLRKSTTESSGANVTETANQIVATECETPNRDSGICVDIRHCSKLLNQLSNKEAWSFLRASTCKQPSVEDFYPKVCCGKYDNFRNTSKNTVVDDVLPKTCGHQKYFSFVRVIGGTPAALGEYPWMALLLHKNEKGNAILGCTGFLIHLQYVITAAHCTHPDSLDGKRGPIKQILLGEHDIETLTDCSQNVCARNTQTYGIAKVTTHPGYDPHNPSRYNDISVIKLKREARETDYVRPICILENDSQIPVSYSVSGWGRTENASHSNVKLKVEIPPLDKFECMEKFTSFRIYLNETQICAGGEENRDTCTGDSGGPLMVNNNGTWYAAGVVSFGVGCGMKSMPGVYTNIVKFLPWIKDQIAQGREMMDV